MLFITRESSMRSPVLPSIPLVHIALAHMASAASHWLPSGMQVAAALVAPGATPAWRADRWLMTVLAPRHGHQYFCMLAAWCPCAHRLVNASAALRLMKRPAGAAATVWFAEADLISPSRWPRYSRDAAASVTGLSV